MKYEDINRKYTEIVAEYIGKGYVINTASMGGSQGETCNVDLTDGTEIIRILVDTFNDRENKLQGVEIVVGKSSDKDVQPHRYSGFQTIWNNRLEIISTVRFCMIGEDRCHGIFYGREDEAKATAVIRENRYIARKPASRTVNITDKAMEIAKRYIRRELGVKHIRESDILVSKRDGVYTVSYKNKSYRLH